jgi:hypothetical protein
MLLASAPTAARTPGAWLSADDDDDDVEEDDDDDEDHRTTRRDDETNPATRHD